MATSSSSVSSRTEKKAKPNSIPRLLTGLSFKSFTEMNCESPTSILDNKPFISVVIGLKTPFSSPKTPDPEARHFLEKHRWDRDTRGIVDALVDDKTDPSLSKNESRMVLFGSQLKLQIPTLPPHNNNSLVSPTTDLPKTPDFGIKTRNSQLGSFSSSGLSPSPIRRSLFGSANLGMDAPNSPRVFAGCLSTSEMEMSEDYTCVISHGPNPRTTHIFDNCIVGFSGSRNESNVFVVDNGSNFRHESFLSFCFTCKKNLGQGKDIYIYRGEKAFCSSECRYREMQLEEGTDALDLDDVYG